jgi:hypothetical protein
VLVHGAAGRVGVAALELGAVAGLRLYGTCSARDRARVEALGAVAIDYRNEDFLALARVREEAGGVDVVADSLGGPISLRSFRALGPGGRLVVHLLSATCTRSRSSAPTAAFDLARVGRSDGSYHWQSIRPSLRSIRYPDRGGAMRSVQPRRSGSRVVGAVSVSPAWELEWLEAKGIDRAEAARDAQRKRVALVALVPAALLAAALSALLSFAPDETRDGAALTIAAAVAAAAAVAVVLIGHGVRIAGPGMHRQPLGDVLLLTVGLLSAGAAAIHLAVARMHFDEYTLFGVFFVMSGIAQLAWAVWAVLRPSRPLLVVGAVGNLLIAVLWAVDRIWGLPIGPEHWKPESIGFADVAASAFEVLLAAGCLALLRRWAPRHAVASPIRWAAAAGLVLAVGVLTTMGLLSTIGVGSSFLTPSA